MQTIPDISQRQTELDFVNFMFALAVQLNLSAVALVQASHGQNAQETEQRMRILISFLEFFTTFTVYLGNYCSREHLGPQTPEGRGLTYLVELILAAINFIQEGRFAAALARFTNDFRPDAEQLQRRLDITGQLVRGEATLEELGWNIDQIVGYARHFAGLPHAPDQAAGGEQANNQNQDEADAGHDNRDQAAGPDDLQEVNAEDHDHPEVNGPADHLEQQDPEGALN
jgi:hypothetical protein